MSWTASAKVTDLVKAMHRVKVMDLVMDWAKVTDLVMDSAMESAMESA